ncbi:unnamed protein product [Sphenostylis stenocarpa]|uniref:Uncharacterized protein n=1 Tax=Sphenostylis stenocarpa TaxID=92480 RepID=A0AA86VJB2_9FABA|nr:unnamed protein product [Sphenostylis stenocarpa]
MQACGWTLKVPPAGPPPGKCNRENESECCHKGKMGMEEALQNVTTRFTQTTLQLCHYQLDGSITEGVITISSSLQMEEGSMPWLLMSVIPEEGVMLNMISSLHAPTMLLDASEAVWKALGVPKRDWGELDILWSDA